MRRLFVALAAVAIASLIHASDRRDAPSRAAAECTSAPTLPQTFVAPTATPARPGLADGLEIEVDRVEAPIVPPPAPSRTDRLVHLVDAQLLEKYLAFRESLTTP